MAPSSSQSSNRRMCYRLRGGGGNVTEQGSCPTLGQMLAIDLRWERHYREHPHEKKPRKSGQEPQPSGRGKSQAAWMQQPTQQRGQKQKQKQREHPQQQQQQHQHQQQFQPQYQHQQQREKQQDQQQWADRYGPKVRVQASMALAALSCCGPGREREGGGLAGSGGQSTELSVSNRCWQGCSRPRKSTAQQRSCKV